MSLDMFHKAVGRTAVLCVAATLLFAGALFGQGTTAQITGRIVDISGAVVPGATITVKNVETAGQWHTVSNSKGLYVVPQLSPGHYEISAKKQGFTVAMQSGITLVVDQVAQVNLVLKVGSITQTVQVTGTAQLLATSTPTTGAVIANQQIQSLPLNGRSPFRLVQLTPGVHSVPSTNGQFFDVPVNMMDDSLISISGGPASANEVMIDGIPTTAGFSNTMTTVPSVDATQEFDVQSGPLKAEWGRSGGGVINVYTKSGTNTVHGDLYEFLRNNAVDANDFFDNAAGKPIPPFRMNQFGFTLGGPIYIPKIYNGHNKNFFFVDYQGTKWRQGQTYISTVPTPRQREGDFSQTYDNKGQLIQIYNPFSTQPDPNNPGQFIRTPFLNNDISGMLDPVALKAMAFIPPANLPGNPITHTNNFISNANRTIDEAELGLKFDQDISSREKLFERFSFNRNTLGQPDTFGNVASPGLGSLGKLYLNNYSGGVNSTTTLSPTSVLSVSYGFARFFWGRPSRSFGFDQSQLDLPASLVNAEAFRLFPSFHIPGYSGIGGGGALLFTGMDTHSLLASLTKISGHHTLKFGVDMRMLRVNQISAGGAQGNYNFAQAMTAGPNPNNFASNAGNSFASFLLGTATSGNIGLPAGSSLQYFYYAGYIQDDFHITPKLTLSYGLRYSATSPVSDRHNEINWFDFHIPSPARNSQFPNLTGGLQFASPSNRTVYNWMTNNFQPRFGFAYNPFRHTVVRGGAGFMYMPLALNPRGNGLGDVPDSGYSSTTPMLATLDGVTPFNVLSDPFPTGLIQPVGSSLGAATYMGQGVTVWNRNPILPSEWQWNFDIQQEAKGFLLDLAYAGSKGTHLAQQRQLNALPDQYFALKSGLQQLVTNPFYGLIQAGALSQPTVAQRQLLLPYPQFTGILVADDTSGNSIYHAMELKVRKPFRHGMTLLVAYTVSKEIADVMNAINNYTNPTNSPLNTGVQNPNNLRAERSVSELDTPQSLSVNYVAQLPFGSGHQFFSGAHGIANRLISGWQSNGIVTYRSGYPLVMSAPIVGGGNRPNRTCSGVISGSRPRSQQIQGWFDTSCFSVPAPFTFGNDSRTEPSLRGPSFAQVDFALEKNDHLFGDRANLMFRAEAFNLLNNPHLWEPVTNRGSLNFGRIQSTTGTPRVIQFALKVSF